MLQKLRQEKFFARAAFHNFSKRAHHTLTPSFLARAKSRWCIVPAFFAHTMRTAREYYEAASRVTILTQPLLIFYGMTALSKTVFMSKHGKKSPSKGHGSRKLEGWTGTFAELSAEVMKDGTFPQFHGCYSREGLDKLTFSVKDLLSLVPEVKVEFEIVYSEKSRALRIQRRHDRVLVVDSELDQYGDLSELIFAIPGMHDVYLQHSQRLENKLVLFYSGINLGARDPSIRAISGDELVSAAYLT